MLSAHVAKEEEELWPLFALHFTKAEQGAIVGRVIGRTGAEAMQAVLPWVKRVMDASDAGDYVDVIRQARARVSRVQMTGILTVYDWGQSFLGVRSGVEVWSVLS